MAKRGRKLLPYDAPLWREISNEVHAEEMRLGTAYLRTHEDARSGPRVFIEACKAIGERRGMDWQVVRLRCLDAKKHHEAVLRMADRFNRSKKRD